MQTNRDAHLLTFTDPCNQHTSHGCAVGTGVPVGLHSVGVQADGIQHSLPKDEERVDYPLSLDELVRVSMELSPVVRVVDGDDIVASGVTFYDIQANQEAIAEALAEFDTTFEATFRSDSFKRPPNAFFGPGLVQPEDRDEATYNFGWTRNNALGGEASLKYNPNPSYLFIPGDTTAFNPRHISELELAVKQPLLKGAGKQVNLAPLQVARINVEQTDWDFKKTLMSSIQEGITAYWELHATDVAVQTIEEMLPLLEEIVRIQSEAFKAEWVTETEVAKAEAQLYEFRQEHEALLSDRYAAELRLRNLIGLPPQDGRRLVASTNPLDQGLSVDAEASLLAALDNQPDIVNQRLNVQLRAIDQQLAINGRRLQLDLFGIMRRNGIENDLGSALDQMLTEDFTDWQFGLELTVPLGRRQAAAAIRAASQRLAREQALLDQQVLTAQHDIQDSLRALEFAFRQLEQATKRLASAEQWVAGAKLRYQNPNVISGDSNVLVTNLNEYLNSLRFRLISATERAQLLAEYNAEIVRLEETKGTLLLFLRISMNGDPCSVTQYLGAPRVVPETQGVDSEKTQDDEPINDTPTDTKPDEQEADPEHSSDLFPSPAVPNLPEPSTRAEPVDEPELLPDLFPSPAVPDLPEPFTLAEPMVEPEYSPHLVRPAAAAHLPESSTFVEPVVDLDFRRNLPFPSPAITRLPKPDGVPAEIISAPPIPTTKTPPAGDAVTY